MITKTSTITFGKYNGFTPEELSASEEGRSYLSWGISNLSNRQWASAFEDALKNKTFNESAVRKMATHTWRNADWKHEDEHGCYVEECVREAKEEYEKDQIVNAIYEKYAAVFGKSPKWLREIFMKYGDEVSPKNFSSAELYTQYKNFCEEVYSIVLK